MDACCETKAEEINALRGKHKNVLTAVLAINATFFIVEVIAGLRAHSTALLGDSLDMFGDALVYGFSLYVLWRSAESKAMAAMLKGVIMAVFGLGVLFEAIHKMVAGVMPVAETMGIIGILVLLANALCFLLLLQHRSDDLNMRSTWLCSRNDIIANVFVLLAAGGVAYFRSAWPDILVGGIIAVLFLKTALVILKESVRQYRELGGNAEASF
jgi:cation diffusion facilitator family transporter